MTVAETCLKAKENLSAIAFASEKDMNAMLSAAAAALRTHAAEIIAENAPDVAACTRGAQFVDRLMLDEKRIDGIAVGLEKLIELRSPVGEVLEERMLYNGLQLRRVRVPFGVIGIIYEARPNVTADAVGLAIKSGNAVVLRGSKDALRSNRAIVRVMKDAIRGAGFNPEFIQLIEDATHEGAEQFMKMNGVKFMSWKHGYNVENCPQLEPVVDAIARYGVHIQIHGGASPLCTPYVWTLFARKHPEINFVFTHVCGREFGTTCIELIRDIPNFFVETSANEEMDILREAVRVLGTPGEYRRITAEQDTKKK